MIKMIAALSKNNQIGYAGHMPWHLPEDLEYFKKITLNHPVIMGRKTYESIGMPLPERTNVVLTRDLSFSAEGVTILHSFDEACRFCLTSADSFIIGGGQIYQAFYPYADELYLTLVDKEVTGDTIFPDFHKDFICTSQSKTYLNTQSNLPFKFTIWKRR